MNLESVEFLLGKDCAKVTPFTDEVTTELKGGSDCFMSLEEVAFELKVTRERVRQIEAKALKKLYHYWVKKGLIKEFKEFLK